MEISHMIVKGFEGTLHYRFNINARQEYKIEYDYGMERKYSNTLKKKKIVCLQHIFNMSLRPTGDLSLRQQEIIWLMFKKNTLCQIK